MKTWFVLLWTFTVLATDTMADANNPYLDKETFYERTNDEVIYDNGNVANQEPTYGEEFEDGYTTDNGNDGYNDDGQEYEEPNYVENRYMRVYQDYYEQCDGRGNPHSYACAKATFAGELAGTNPRAPSDFQLYDLNLQNLNGEWIAVTYVNPSGNSGDEFFMTTNQVNSNQPLGVYNVNTNTAVGSVWIGQSGMSFDNWQGQQIDTFSVEIVSSQTVVLKMQEGNYVHQLTCRDFNRSNKHHLFCAWDVEVPGQGWRHHGYMGFLSRANWDDFLRNGVSR